jgi:hypothetical protein
MLCWNDSARVLALMDALARLVPAPDRIIVVDNGSAGDHVARLIAVHPRLTVIELGYNSGFAAAANRGIREALGCGAGWVWLLNTDVELEKDTLASLVNVARSDARCGMAASLLVETGGEVQARGGGRVNLWTGSSRHVIARGEPCHYLTGACLLLRSSMLREIGLFDEAYFFYWEDVDLGFRARKAGWTFAVADAPAVVHLEGSTLGRWSRERWYHMFRGMKRFLFANAPLPRTALAVRLFHHSAAMLRHGRRDAIRGAWQAALEPRR